jgi:hypothetical protein
MQFHLGDILSITTGRLVSNDGIDGVYKILNFMTGDNLFTHQLPRAATACKPFLLKQFPLLEDVETKYLKGIEPKAVPIWLEKQVALYGDFFEASPLPPGGYQGKDPIQEAVEMMGADRVIEINPKG